MYFDKFVNEIGRIRADIEKAEKKRTDDLTAAQNELDELKNAQEQAANNGNDNEYTALIGKIAVLAAKVKRLENESVVVANPEDIRNFVDSVNKAYAEKMMGQRKIIEECAQKMLDAGGDMAVIAEEMTDIAHSSAGCIGTDAKAFLNDGGDVTGINKFFNRIINPSAEYPSNTSILGYCKFFNYEQFGRV